MFPLLSHSGIILGIRYGRGYIIAFLWIDWFTLVSLITAWQKLIVTDQEVNLNFFL